MAPRALVLACATVVVFGFMKPGPAQAQPAGPADTLIERGLDERAHQRDADALADFTLAYKTEPSARALAQIALAEQALGRWVDAEKHLVEAGHSEADPWIAKHKEVLSRALKVIQDHLASLDVSCSQPNAVLWLNGASVGPLPLAEQRVAVGTVLVEIRAPGFEDYRETVSVDPRQTLHVAPELSPKRPAVVVPVATPPLNAPPPVASQKGPVSVAVTAQVPEMRPQDGRASSTHQRTLAWTLLAVGGGLLAGAVTANVAREMSLAHYNNDRSCFYGMLSRSQRCGTSLGEANVEGVAAIAAYAGAAMAGGAGTYFFVTAEPAAPGRMASPWHTIASAVWSF